MSRPRVSHLLSTDVLVLIGTLADLLLTSVNQLQDALTGLERILTTPIPFS